MSHRTRFAPPCFLLLFGLIAPAIAAQPATQPVLVDHDVMLPMHDGVSLATDIYRPAASGQATADKLPVILTRTPYGKDGARTMAQYYASHGYVFAAQDTRGRYKSDGVWHMLTDDGPDGVDTCAWLAKLRWCNGKVAMIGTS
jgi:putative CocE/NonD family hydrolase